MAEEEKVKDDPQGGTPTEPENSQGEQKVEAPDKTSEKLKELEDELGKWQHLAEKYKKEAGDYRISKKEVEEEVGKLKDQVSQTRREADLTKEALKIGADPDLTLAYLKSNGGFESDEDVSKLIEKAIEDKPNLKNGKAVATGDTKKDKEDKTDLNSWIHAMAGKK